VGGWRGGSRGAEQMHWSPGFSLQELAGNSGPTGGSGIPEETRTNRHFVPVLGVHVGLQLEHPDGGHMHRSGSRVRRGDT